MFTGIIESIGEVIAITPGNTNISFTLRSVISKSLTVDQSINHNGVCLTVENINEDTHTITAISETLSKTNLSAWKPGDKVNLERALSLHSRIDGHIVQGHVDATAVCTGIENMNGSWQYIFDYNAQFSSLMIEKGSVCVNGVSLTAFNVADDRFTVAIIPYTMEHTNFQMLSLQSIVNIEFDMIGKYVTRFRKTE